MNGVHHRLMSFEKPSSWDESGWKVLNYTRSHCLMKIWTGKAGTCVRPKYVRTGSFGPKMVITEPFLRTAGIIILTARIYDNCSISTAGGSQGLGKAHQPLVRFLGGHLGPHVVVFLRKSNINRHMFTTQIVNWKMYTNLKLENNLLTFFMSFSWL